MKRTNIIRVLSLLLCMATLLSLSLIPAAASDEGISSETTEEYTATWSYNEATGELTAYFPDTETTLIYTRITLPSRLVNHPSTLYRYEEKINIGGDPFLITSPDGRRGESVVLQNTRNYDDTHLFVTEERKQLIEEYRSNRDFTSYRLVYETQSSTYDTGLPTDVWRSLATLPAEGQITRTLFELKDETVYCLWGRPDYKYTYHVAMGYVYDLNGQLYFLDASTMSEDNFNGQGGLNPKPSVTVTLTPLTEELTQTVYDELDEATVYSTSISYEQDYVDRDSYDSSVELLIAVFLLYITVIPLGVLLPIFPFAVGLILPHLTDFGKKKRWYLVTAISAIWIVLSILLLLIVTIAALLV